jgi:acetoin utilization protein AcuB
MADTDSRRRLARSDSAPILPHAGARVRDIMSPRVLAVAPATESGRAIEIANERHVEHLMVARGSELIGVLCTCDLWEAMQAPVASVMSSPPVTIDADASIEAAAEIVRTTGLGCLPVLERGRVVGVVTRGDLARHGLLDLADNTCASCGSHHHVRRLAGYASAFCTLCLDKTPSSVAYDELGWGD